MTTAPRLLVLQHSPIDHPGVMREFLREDGVDWHPVDLHEGHALPPLDDYDAVLIMGGPQQSDEEVRYSWLGPEKAMIRDAILGRDMPVLGICLGAQLIADAMGGAVGAMPDPEIGVLDFELTEQGAKDPLFAGLPHRPITIQWHLNSITRLPKGATHMARSAVCDFQAFRVGRAAYGLQFHMEISADMVRATDAFPEYVSALEAQQGPGALERFAQETERHGAALADNARCICENFVALASMQAGLEASGVEID